MELLSEFRNMTKVFLPPLQPVKVLPTEMQTSERRLRTSAAIWSYGVATLLVIGLLKAQYTCRKTTASRRKRQTAGVTAASTSHSSGSVTEEQSRPLIDQAAGIDEAAEAKKAAAGALDFAEVEQRAATDQRTDFVIYHMLYVNIGFCLVYWACQQKYLNQSGLDYELYAYWFIESAVTHLLCAATPKQFLSSLAPVFSERYDLMKDTVAAGIYARLGSTLSEHGKQYDGIETTVGYILSFATVLTIVIPSIINYRDPVTARLSRIAYWPQEMMDHEGGEAQAPQKPGSIVGRQHPAIVRWGVVSVVKQLEEATREHRRALNLLEDLPQLLIAVVYAYYAKKMSPFIVVNMTIAVLKTTCILFGRRFCLAWMAVNEIPWPAIGLSSKDLTGTASSQSMVAACFGQKWAARALRDTARAENVEIGARLAAAQELLELCRSDFQYSGKDIVKYTDAMRAHDAVASLMVSKSLSRQGALDLATDWEPFHPQDLRFSLDRLRAAVDGQDLQVNDYKAGTMLPLVGCMSRRLATGSQQERAAVKVLGAACTEEAAHRLLSEGGHWFTDEDKDVRKAVCQAMMVVTWDQPYAIHKIALATRAIEDNNSHVRHAAWKALASRVDGSVELLDELLQTNNYFDRENPTTLKGACFAVQMMGLPRAAAYQDAVSKLLGHDEFTVREQAYRALVSFGEFRKVMNAAVNRRDSDLTAVLEALGQAQSLETLEEDLVVTLISFCFDGTETMNKAVKALEKAGRSAQVKAAEEVSSRGLLRDERDHYGKDYDIQLSALAVLALLTSLSPPQIGDVMHVAFETPHHPTVLPSPPIKKKALAVQGKALEVLVNLDGLVNYPEVTSRALDLVGMLRHEDTSDDIRYQISLLLSVLASSPEVRAHAPDLVSILEERKDLLSQMCVCDVLGAFGATEEVKPFVPILEQIALTELGEWSNGMPVQFPAWIALLRLDICVNNLASEYFQRAIRLEATQSNLKSDDVKVQVRACFAFALLGVDEECGTLNEEMARIYTSAVNRRESYDGVLKLLASLFLAQKRSERKDALALRLLGQTEHPVKMGVTGKKLIFEAVISGAKKIDYKILLAVLESEHSISSLDSRSDLIEALCYCMRLSGRDSEAALEYILVSEAALELLKSMGVLQSLSEGAAEAQAVLTALLLLDFKTLGSDPSSRENQCAHRLLGGLVEACEPVGRRFLQLLATP